MLGAIDSDLQGWSTLSSQEWPTLLLGNGLSINLWEGFAYSSLFSSASLTPAAQSIFAELGTTNFEQCLECLHHAGIALKALRDPTTRVNRTYEEVRDALFEAVGTVHVPWELFPQRTHDLLARELNEYRAVFTTNYDLCLYWSHMQTDEDVNIVDYFWASGNQFDPADTAVRSSRATRIHYIHGGIHLWQDDQTGENGKWTASRGRLLDVQSRYRPGEDRRPLFVSEGTSPAKTRTIRQSSYLSFCLDELRSDDQPTVVFGHALADQDRHMVAALAEGKSRRIAVSMFPAGDEHTILAEKARIIRALARHDVKFFDSTTHPIGDGSLRISSV
jgi:hypothetical protein